jgi:preprotein translocase subunit SecE
MDDDNEGAEVVADRDKPTEQSRDAALTGDVSPQLSDDLTAEPSDPAPNDQPEVNGSERNGSGAADGLVAVGAPRRRPASAGAESGGSASVVRGPKGRATPSQRRTVKKERTGPVGFVRESIGELRKVVYPTGQQVIQYFVVVLVFVLFVIAYVSLLDLGLGAAIFKIFS